MSFLHKYVRFGYYDIDSLIFGPKTAFRNVIVLLLLRQFAIKTTFYWF